MVAKFYYRLLKKPLAFTNCIKQLNMEKACIVQVIEHGMTSLSFQTAVQKNETKLSSVQFENEMASYRAL